MSIAKISPSIGLCALAIVIAAIGSRPAAADQVIPDDLIVQGSTCVGLDCVNNENFGFDTIKLKENNLRIFFQDTSLASGFPTNDWRLIANDSVAGGANFFAIEDATLNRNVFTVSAGAEANAIFVDSSSRVGFRTATPALDLHVNAINTPGLRLQQNIGGGFTPQTWDVAGNDANFFVRDLTNGSHLPFRIRPGAPTSSLDIAASGNVGIGTTSPNSRLTVTGVDDNNNGQFMVISSGNDARIELRNADGGSPTGRASILMSKTTTYEGLRFMINNVDRVIVDEGGNLGIGTTAPGAQLHTTGSVRLAGVPNCGSGIVSSANGTLSCLASSARFKNLAGALPADIALANVMRLKPQTGSYKETPDVPEHWLIAEDVAAVDTALVGLHEGQPHVVKTQNVVADLIAVVQQQQRRIDELERLVRARN
jgi:hypothetical protein